MFGQDYLDWKSECAAAKAIDAFLEAMPADDRKWALAVLRKRHVTYRDNPLNQLGQGLSGQLAIQNEAWRRQQCGRPNFGPTGSILSNIFGR